MSRFSSKTPPSQRESFRLPQADTLRHRKDRLKELTSLIEEEQSSAAYRPLSSRRLKKFNLMVDEQRMLAYQLRSEQEREELFKDIFATEEQLAAAGNSPDEREYRITLLKLRSAIPAAIYGKEYDRYLWRLRGEKKDPIQESVELYKAQQERVAHDLIASGIPVLAEQLTSIQQSTGAYPEALVYPDASGRILRYAVKPLVEHMYRAAGQPFPREHFIKVFSDYPTPSDRARSIEMLQQTSEEISEELKANMDERRAKIQQLRRGKVNAAEREELSVRAHQLWQEGMRLQDRLRAQQERIAQLLREEDVQLVRERVRQICAQSSGAFLMIDDLFSNGRTVRSLVDAFDAQSKKEQLYAFVFLGSSKLPDGISPAHVAVGSIRASRDDHPFPARVGRVVYPDNPEMDAVDEMYLRGFPFRWSQNKGAVTGVKKDQLLFEPFVRRSPEADPVRMRAERGKYRNWGEQAVREMILGDERW